MRVPLHTSCVQELPSSVQLVPAGFTVSVGQMELVPEHVSAMSHSLTAARHTVPEDANVQELVQQGSVFTHCGDCVQLALAVWAKATRHATTTKLGNQRRLRLI